MTTGTNDQPKTNSSREEAIDNNNVDNVVENEDDNENENDVDNTIEDEDDDEDDEDDEDDMNTNKLGKRLMDTNFENKKHMKEGTSFDVIVVEGGEDGSTLYENSDFLVSFKGEKVDKGGTIIDNHDPNKIIVMEIVQDGDKTTTSTSEKVWFQINKGRSDGDNNVDGDGSGDEEEELPLVLLKSFLKPGRNPIRYLLLDKQQRIVLRAAQANIFLWNYQDSVVVSDIDGTVTKSNARGTLGTIVTKQYGKVCHDGICHLLTTLSKHKSSKSSSSSSTIQVVYVTSRPISLANQTRQLLSGLKQGTDKDNNESNLPHGPLLGFGGKMSKVLMMEVITHSTNEFKSTKLWQQVVKPFREANANAKNNNSNDSAPTFVAGFGNTSKDVQAYHAIGIDLDRIYMIDKKSKIVTFDKKIDTDNDNNNSITTRAPTNPMDDNFIFQPEKFYKDRIGTEFNGYTDAKLLYQFGFYDSDEDKKAQIKKYLVA
jgi:hypothetical protein